MLYSPIMPVGVPGGLTPEQAARVEIDRLLEAAGWAVQDREKLDLSAARGIAVREFHVKTGFADYLLYGDRRVLGTIEAKKVGEPLLGVPMYPSELMPSSVGLCGRSTPLIRTIRGSGTRTGVAGPRPGFAHRQPTATRRPRLSRGS